LNQNEATRHAIEIEAETAISSSRLLMVVSVQILLSKTAVI
jgi:hypothetical protein